jgi:hypothetical protein
LKCRDNFASFPRSSGSETFAPVSCKFSVHTGSNLADLPGAIPTIKTRRGRPEVRPDCMAAHAVALSAGLQNRENGSTRNRVLRNAQSGAALPSEGLGGEKTRHSVEAGARLKERSGHGFQQAARCQAASVSNLKP